MLHTAASWKHSYCDCVTTARLDATSTGFSKQAMGRSVDRIVTSKPTEKTNSKPILSTAPNPSAYLYKYYRQHPSQSCTGTLQDAAVFEANDTCYQYIILQRTIHHACPPPLIIYYVGTPHCTSCGLTYSHYPPQLFIRPPGAHRAA